MPRRLWRFRVQDILDAIDAIETYTAELDEESFEDERVVVDAVLRNLTVIGEAAANLPDGITCLAPHVPWQSVIGMRNIIVHEYFGVSLPMVWQTVTSDLPALREQLESLLLSGPEDSDPT